MQKKSTDSNPRIRLNGRAVCVTAVLSTTPSFCSSFLMHFGSIHTYESLYADTLHLYVSTQYYICILILSFSSKHDFIVYNEFNLDSFLNSRFNYLLVRLISYHSISANQLYYLIVQQCRH